MNTDHHACERERLIYGLGTPPCGARAERTPHEERDIGDLATGPGEPGVRESDTDPVRKLPRSQSHPTTQRNCLRAA